ncbi:lytic transglycosylase domain-containing protein [Phascolarctobacterium succinatutens]|uniref:lytic transglycosylase domain-containing protein n=1 Tax=Phascolarctobacterium succinatutens TaxID=626940 RepID=UPI0026ECCE80|nr:lytic transglycosylase domain-containing protein [Phascolarctobacterium succinatutens]
MSVKVNRRSRSRRLKKSGRLHSWLLMLGVLLAVCFGCWKIWSSDAVQMRFVYMWDYQQDIVTYSKKNNVDPFLVAAIIKNESNFKHDAVSKVGAVGLMQIMPETGRWIAEQMGLENYQDSDLYQTRKNIRMGCWYVGELEHEFQHNLVLLMVAYNAGRGQTHEWMQENGWDYNFNDIQSIPYPDTREYVAKVMQDRDKYYLLYKDKIK